MLFRVIYASQASFNMNYGGLRAIMESAIRNNGRTVVTGMLCFGDDRFLQVLEGPRDAVCETMSKIYADTRHRNIILIEATTIEDRIFPDWQMKMVMLDDHPSQQIEELCREHFDSDHFEPQTMDTESALGFMQALTFSFA